jgi:hypothetical protein
LVKLSGQFVEIIKTILQKHQDVFWGWSRCSAASFKGYRNCKLWLWNNVCRQNIWVIFKVLLIPFRRTSFKEYLCKIPQWDDALVPAVCPSSNWPLQEILRETTEYTSFNGISWPFLIKEASRGSEWNGQTDLKHSKLLNL